MKKLLILSTVLVVVGLGLVLYSDPVLAQVSGAPARSGHLNPEQIQNATSGGSLPPGCTPQPNGGIVCGSSSINSSPLGLGGVVPTGIGIALCGVGLFITGVESFSKQESASSAKTVT